MSAYLRTLEPADLAYVLTAGMTFTELPIAGSELSLVRRMHHGADFVIEPLPNLLFTRDSSFWIGPRVAIPSLALPARMRETSLTDLIYAHHPRFLGVPGLRVALGARGGGDVLLLSPGVVAVGVGSAPRRRARKRWRAACSTTTWRTRCWRCRSRRSARRCTWTPVCTMVDTDAVVMYPAISDSLSAFTITRVAGGIRIGDEEPFVTAAADAMGIDRLRVIDTGLDPITAEREQWDDGNNTLALAPGVVVAYERNSETNARLADSGIEVLPIAASELGTGRGGPRCMSCPVARDPL